MITINNSLNIISFILLFIIFYSIISSTIYFKKYENFLDIVDNFNDNEENDIYKKCPRGCGFHHTLPNCEECGPDKPDYDTATLEERKWIDKYHIVGDKAKAYAEKIIKKWKEVNPKALFRFTFLYKNELQTVSIHPDYQIKLYNKYHPDDKIVNITKNEEIKKITNWIKNIQLDLKKFSDLPNLHSPNNWTYIDIIPESWVDEIIDDIVIKEKLASESYYKSLNNDENNNLSDELNSKNLFEYINNKKKIALEKIFDACNFKKNGIISNAEEFRYLMLALDEESRKNENEYLLSICSNFEYNINCDSLELSEIWDLFFNNIKKNINDSEILKKDTFILNGINTLNINEIQDAIKYLEKQKILDSTHNINSELNDIKEKNIDIIISDKKESIFNNILKLKKTNKLNNEYSNDIRKINWESKYKKHNENSNNYTDSTTDIDNNSDNYSDSDSDSDYDCDNDNQSYICSLYEMASNKYKYFESDIKNYSNKEEDALIKLNSEDIKLGFKGLHINDIINIINNYEKKKKKEI